MAKDPYHVFPVLDGRWSVRRGGAARASKTFDVKVDAVSFGKHLSSNDDSELVIHRKDGTIDIKNSRGNDPFPPKDKS
jgi:Uncharacterized protein conserved in bacteria (DUF2188)